MMKLYGHLQSGHSHRVRLFLSLLALDYELVEVDLRRHEHLRPEFVAMNPFHQIPVLDDGGVLIADSNAILVYLARKHARNDWLPEDPQGMAEVQRWFSIAAGEVARGPCAARLVTVWNENLDGGDEAIRRAHGLLTILDAVLVDRDWLVRNQPTLAEVSLYTYIAHAPEGFVDLSAYRHVMAWLQRIERLDRFLPMMRTPVGLQA